MSAKKSEDPSFLFRHRFRILPAPGTPSCRMCGSPTHPSTGSSDGFCGACCRSLVHAIKDVANPRRSCGGVLFYEHNQPLGEYHTVAFKEGGQ